MQPQSAAPAAAGSRSGAATMPPHLLTGADPPPSSVTPAPAAPQVKLDEDDAQQLHRSGTAGSRFLILVGGSVLLLLIVGGVVAIGLTHPEWFRIDGSAGAGTQSDVYVNSAGGKTVWSDSSKAQIANNVKVRIDRVEYGEVRAKDARHAVQISDQTNFLQVFVEIENLSPTEIQYRSWYGNRDHAVRLTDDTGRVYPMMTFGDVTRIRGHTPTASMQKGAEASDVLIFELPAEVDRKTLKHLRIELPAGTYGGRGTYRFQIPAEKINYTPASVGSS